MLALRTATSHEGLASTDLPSLLIINTGLTVPVYGDVMTFVSYRGFLMVAVAAVVGCANPPPVGRADLLDFLEVGVTRREEVRMRLGEASSQYEGERMLAFRLRKDSGGYALVKPGGTWAGVDYNLMLAFDGEGVLRRQALVEVRSP